ncbi:MAG: hypothetical protein A3E87_05060 [Gammaproteobacteria bacterium RIFCSPHIGHO2_12_FULL_35_23]|nr:MAG: hypothetical protein A3E87_05060 [Gammaproteobacteria bacterium RIFCSPHIGHO2_12_FULL_35_23]
MTILGLGTAQFGMPYGITNAKGQCSLSEIVEILKISIENKIQIIDTAVAYGQSEQFVGKALQGLPPGLFKIITKVPSDCTSQAMQAVFQQSLNNLRQNKIYGLLVHNAKQLLLSTSDLLWNEMESFKAQGLVKKIGVSVYTGKEIDQILERFNIDIIQLPINVFDQKLEREGYLQKLKNKGIEIHVRSIFLQGIILSKPENLPSKLNELKPIIIKLNQYCKQKNVLPLQLALAYIWHLKQIDHALVGVTGVKEFQSILNSIVNLPTDLDYSIFNVNKEYLVNPAMW